MMRRSGPQPGFFASKGARSLVAALALAGLCSGPARAGLFDDEEARKAILDLRAKLEAQQQANAALQSEVSNLKRGLLDLNNQLETTRADLARLSGQQEQTAQSVKELGRDVAEVQRKQKDASAAVDERLRKFEPQTVTVDGREGQVEPDEKRAFDDALAVLRKSDYPGAVTALQGFLKRYPSSLYGGQARYWLGNAYYGKGDLKEAAATLRNFVAALPDHPRAPDAMLSLANCQVELKDSKAARKTLDDLIKTHPQTEAAKAGRERLAQLK